MELNTATELFAALSQKTRLLVFRRLVQAPSQGIRAGELSDALDVPANTLSFHLNHLSNAGLVVSDKIGRSVYYRINGSAVSGLIRFLIEDCCSLATKTIQHEGGTETVYSLRSLSSGNAQTGDTT
ncbi:MAG: metalloregulator ArsR/SmtB family transcription factor [Pseudomonadota bacterium]